MTNSAPDWHQGMVRAAQANFYRVWQPSGQEWLCTRRARLQKIGQTVLVGDHVWFSLSGERGVIEAVLPRRSWLTRPAVANADQALVIFALADPPLDPVPLSRFLVQVEASGLQVQVCLNKRDLVADTEAERWIQRLQSWGYSPLMVSAVTGEGLIDLRQCCQGKISVVTGISGVGKSTLLNHLVPGLTLQTNAVSGRLRHGQHTTRHVELYPFPGSGWIADTPGFNQVTLEFCQPQRLLSYFPEVRHLDQHCQFQDCQHDQEPGCAVRQYNWERYPYYLDYLLELTANQGSLNPTESTLKTRSGRGSIPRLASRYRQTSRRSQRQGPMEDTDE
ncbi:MAG: small ribosomal subunit biogenesis GTPase RsgA [Synechococcales cyanobacterium]